MKRTRLGLGEEGFARGECDRRERGANPRGKKGENPLGGVRIFLYRLKPLKLTQLQEPYNSLIPMSLWIIWLLK